MADNRKEYTLTVNDIEHRVLMDPEEAEKGGLKAYTPANTGAAPADNKAGAVRTK